MSKWRKISTAPKDGTVILGYNARRGILTMCWDNLYMDRISKSGKLIFAKGWSAGIPSNWGLEETRAEFPTHWQPLPNPPEQS